MKQTLTLILVLFWLGTLPAQNIVFHSEWEDSIDAVVLKDRVLVEFRQGTPLATQQLILQLVGLQDAWFIPYPEVVVAKIPFEVRDYQGLKNIIEALHQYNNVKIATPFIESAGAQPFGILPTVAVKVENETALMELLGFAERNHIYPVYKDAYLANIYWLSTNKYSDYNALEAAVMLNQSGLFAFAEPNYLLSPLVPSANDQFYNRQWNISNNDSTVYPNTSIIGTPNADMDVDSAWTLVTGSPNIKVAVLDAGVDTLHPDLVDNLLPGFDATGGGSNGYPNLDKPSNAHGTACAGIIGATANNGIGVAGVAHGVKIIPIKVFYYLDTVYNGLPLNNIPYSTSQWMATAINWAWRDAEADVMSNSWGVDDVTLQLLSGNPALVNEAILAAKDSGRAGLGTPMLFSSGNEDTRPIWPSRLTTTIAVNATSMCDERKTPTSCDLENWWTGCWGYDLEVSAPGVKIATCDISGVNGYRSGDYTFEFNGTSAACPNAAAVVALMLSIRPDLSFDAVRFILGNTADKVGGYDYSSSFFAGPWSLELGYGRVNAYKAVMAAQAYTGHEDLSGIADIKQQQLPLSLYPNPLATQQLHLNFDLPRGADAQVQILSIDGKVVFTASLGMLSSGQNEHTINLARPLQAGTYLVNLVTNNQASYAKLVVTSPQ